MGFQFFEFLYAFQVIGVIFGLAALIIGLTKGRHAIKLTGGGVVAITVKYLLIATTFFVVGFMFNAVGFLVEIEFANVIGSIMLFGQGLCFFVIFWELAKHMDKLQGLLDEG